MPDRVLFVGGPLDGQIQMVHRWPWAVQKRTGDVPLNEGGKPVGMTVAFTTVHYYPHAWHGITFGVVEGLYREARHNRYGLPLSHLKGAALRLLFDAVKRERIDPPDNDDAINAAMDLAELVLDAVEPEQERTVLDSMRFFRG